MRIKTVGGKRSHAKEIVQMARGIKNSEMNPSVARQRVERAATVAEAAVYLYREVGLGAIRALALAVGLRVRENSDLTQRWCARLAARLRGNPVA